MKNHPSAGSVYQQKGSPYLSTRFRHNGKVYAQVTDTTDYLRAEEILQERRLKSRGGVRVDGVVPLSVLADKKLQYDRDKKHNKDIANEVSRWNAMKDDVGDWDATTVDTAKLEELQMDWSEAGVHDTTINRRMAFLRSGYKIGKRWNLITNVPEFPPEYNEDCFIRENFVTDDQYEPLVNALVVVGGHYLRTLFETLYCYAWRSKEGRTLLVGQINFYEGTIKIRRGATKNGNGKTVAMTKKLRKLLETCCQDKSTDQQVFTYKDGTPVLDFRRAWEKATKLAALPDLLVHDLRRSGVRNMRRQGIDKHVIMQIAGMETDSIFERYDIIDEDDLVKAAESMDARDERLEKLAQERAAKLLAHVVSEQLPTTSNNLEGEDKMNIQVEKKAAKTD
jgi:integrase